MMRSIVWLALLVCKVRTRGGRSPRVITVRDRIAVAHLADHDHVRVLAHAVAQGFLEGRGVGPDLALRHRGHVVREQKLDRVLDGHDVAGAGLAMS